MSGMKDALEIGDIVNVFFESSQMIASGTILHIPSATGECWRLKKRDGRLVYVHSFSVMELCGEIK